MNGTEQIIDKFSKQTSFLGKVVAVVTPIAFIFGGLFWYFNNIWKPKIKLDNVDYDKLAATLTVNGHKRVLYAGSTVNAGYGWGVRFAGTTTDTYDRVEIVKNDLTHTTISTKA